MNDVIAYSSSSDLQDRGAGQNLSFHCMKIALALPINRVREIIEYGHLTAVPMMPNYVLGVINLRGNVVPVVDLSARFGAGATVLGRRTCIIILELPNTDGPHLVGLVVDAVDEVLDIEMAQIEPPPSFGTAIRSDFIMGMARREQGFLIILKVDKLLDLEELLPIVDVPDAVITE